MVTAPWLVVLIGANIFFGDNFLPLLLISIFVALIMIIVTLIVQIPRSKMAEDEDGLRDREKQSETLEHYAKDIEKSREETERFRIRYEESERKLREYTRLLKEAAIYERQLAEYEKRKISALQARERLWERTRLCMRCGTAYLGPG
jgi:cell shape-determining protein MreC